ncbi:MAG: NrtA/SsuA/CpmA family ABC transporter substrate-binding protein [Spirochaetaceae bacterium]|jgi:ABC-type nitrate/sulfonate/bicarbonate transport system substrate-binding protein|nr:NrtA/SsuA/CpmA family ABC transporter substrate-binding protein [Spirochaetaceae bacterium]
MHIVSRFVKVFCVVFVSAALVSGCKKERPLPEAVNVSYVESPFNLQIMVMKEQGRLEKAFAEKNVAVRWHNINSGAQQTQAMASGDLDVASVINSTSVILANAAGNEVDVAAVFSRPQRSFALVVRPDGPASVKELRGKTIAGPKGTVLHQMLVAALVAEGMSADDVNFMQMGLPEARTALLSGRIDGALQAAALILRDEEAGMRVLFTADGLLATPLWTAVRPVFALDYPELVELYLSVQHETADWILANVDEAVAIGAKTQDVSFEDGKKLYAWGGMASRKTAAVGEADLASLESDVAFLLDQQMIIEAVRPQDFLLTIDF